MSFMRVDDIRPIHSAAAQPAPTIDTKDIVLFCHQLIITSQGGDVIKTAAQEAGIKILCVRTEKPILYARKPIQLADFCFFVAQRNWPKIRRTGENIEVLNDGKFWKTVWYEIKTNGLPDPLPHMGSAVHVLGLISADGVLLPVKEKRRIEFVSEIPESDKAAKSHLLYLREKAAEAHLLQDYELEIRKSIDEFNRSDR